MKSKDFYIVKWNKDFYECSENFENLTGFTQCELKKFPFKHHSLVEDGRGEKIP